MAPTRVPPWFEGCTAAVIPAESSASGAPLLWKNRDLASRWLRPQVLLFSEGDEYKRGFVAATTAGHLGVGMGINEAGLAVENTFVFAGRYVNPEPRWGNLALMRRVLEEAGSVEEAAEALASARGKYSGSSFLAVDPRSAAVIDVVGDEALVYTPVERGFLARTNHWEPVAPRELWKYEVNRMPEESVKRYEAAHAFLAERLRQGPIGLKDLMELSRNTANGLGPSSPCRFPRRPGAPREAVDESTTISAAVMAPYPEDPELSVLWVALGNPLTTIYMPVLAAARRYAERAVEIANAKRFAEEAPRLEGLRPDEIMARLREISEPWLAPHFMGSEPWIAAERIREVLLGPGATEEERHGVLSKYVERLRRAEAALISYVDAVQKSRASAPEALERLVDALSGAWAEVPEVLGGLGSRREAAAAAARILMALYAVLRADAWGLWGLTGDPGWADAGRRILEAYHEARSIVATAYSS